MFLRCSERRGAEATIFGKKDVTRGRPADETSDDETNDEEKIGER
jgi:hypothetical protein